jgi:2-polyprenyl-6-methoxyphenol hydroxylase-like FAD-dependent oxidoreductase
MKSTFRASSTETTTHRTGGGQRQACRTGQVRNRGEGRPDQGSQLRNQGDAGPGARTESFGCQIDRPEETDMGGLAGQRAVVLGGSMGGLVAARALSEHFTEVVVVDRDELTGVRGPRRGVPHGRHAHGLVARGQQLLEELLPGLTEELRADGVPTGDFNADARWYFGGRRMQPGRSGLACISSTRPVLEYHVRERVHALANVSFLERHDVLGLVNTPDGARVLGAAVRDQRDGAVETLEADLVVDTTGRGSRTPAWLEGMGYQRPVEQKVGIGLAYTTRHYRVHDDPFGTDLIMISAPTPECTRGGFFHRVPSADGRVVELSLTGMLGDHPPTEPDAFEAFARSLPVPDIYAGIRDAEPLDDPVKFSYPASVWRHYEQLTRFPAGLLLLGDAVCSFNPLYAQGMTVATLESIVLHEALADGRVPEARTYFRAVAKVVSGAWEFSAGADLGYPEVEGRRTVKVRMANAYVGALQRAAVHDSVLTDAFVRAAGLVDPPARLLRPRNLIRVWRQSRRRAAAPTGAPATPPAGDDRQPETLTGRK